MTQKSQILYWNYFYQLVLSLSDPYSLSGTNQLCSYGHKNIRQRIDDVERCKDATKELGYGFKDSRSRASFPAGCYLFKDTNLTYFNTHSTGRTSKDAKQICMEEGRKEIRQISRNFLFYSIKLKENCMYRWYLILIFIAVIYVPSEFNQFCSDVNELFDITDVDECKLAAEDLRLIYKGKFSETSNPKGCYYNRAQKKVYFNEKRGSRDEDARPICKKSGKIAKSLFPNISKILIIISKVAYVLFIVTFRI